MKHKSRDIINLKAIRFEVDDLEQSIAFYRKLGCVIEEVQNSYHSISAYISFCKDSTTLLHLVKDFSRTEKLTEELKFPVFELEAIESEDSGFPEVFDEIYQNGINYTNVDAEVSIPAIAQFTDESGRKYELIEELIFGD